MRPFTASEDNGYSANLLHTEKSQGDANILQRAEDSL